MNEQYAKMRTKWFVYYFFLYHALWSCLTSDVFALESGIFENFLSVTKHFNADFLCECVG